MKIPVSGLTFSDDGLDYNNIPLSQCSDGEKLMVSMGISMALNPTLRVLRIKDGSLLGPKNMAILKETVKEEGFQLWIEMVQGRDRYNKEGKVGIFIEEGEAEGEGVVEDAAAGATDAVAGKDAKKPRGTIPIAKQQEIEDEPW